MTDAPPPATYAVIAGGGTAGHVLPGLAIAQALVDAGHDRASIRFVGSARGLEVDLVPEAGYALEALPGRGIQRKLSLANVAAAIGIVRATLQAIGLLRRWRPKVLLVLGGYAAAPCVVAGALWRVPMVVAEQNARAGLANRLAGRFARACAVPFPETDLPRTEVTGNPVRAELLALDPGSDRARARAELGLPGDRVVVAAFSGSLGARSINRAVHALAGRWAARGDVAIRHVTGSRDWDEFRTVPDEGPADGAALVYQTVAYEQHMDLLLAAADVVVSRAGGTTVAELAVVGVPAVLVPLPIATRDHQTANAQALVRGGAARLVPDDELDVDRLEAELGPLVDDAELRTTMAAAARAQGIPDAAARVAALLEREARS